MAYKRFLGITRRDRIQSAVKETQEMQQKETLMEKIQKNLTLV